MHQFFIEASQLQEEQVMITGMDVNHIKNVLRMRIGEKLFVVDKTIGRNYCCKIREFQEDAVFCDLIYSEASDTELPAKIYLFQGLPKSDKMELIIQKAVELGCFEIIPMVCARCVVKLDEKKRKSRQQRWQGISEAAAKQSKRGLIPRVRDVMPFSEALSFAKDMEVKLIPYEKAEGIAETKKQLSRISPEQKIAVFIGPEGGFEETEIEAAKQAGVIPVTLGKRILRTETAGFTILSWLMYELEK